VYLFIPMPRTLRSVNSEKTHSDMRSEIYPCDVNSGLANLPTGYLTSFAQTNDRFYGSSASLQRELYAKDSTKVGRNLTIDVGAHYRYLLPTYTRGTYSKTISIPCGTIRRRRFASTRAACCTAAA
jgi:hypothetical protein